MKIALAGNPNSGKTTLFNEITGKIEKVGNWPGVTVEKKEGYLKDTYNPTNSNVMVVDLPGAYSMSPFSNEESITRDFVKNEDPDVIINILDATNISRGLFLTSQLLELGIPVVIALNKIDLNREKGILIDSDLMGELLSCSVFETVATSSSKKNGLIDLLTATVTKYGLYHSQKVAQGLEADSANNENAGENNEKKRYSYIDNLVAQVERRCHDASKSTFQDKIDSVVANKWLGLPVFAAVIWLVFSISQTWVGPPLADLLVSGIDALYGIAEGWMGQDVHPVLSALLLDGIIGGVGAVIGFLPLIMVLFFMLALLEDSGYMSRIAVVMDPFFKRIGLTGRSVIPMIVATGCAIPGIMATRTIRNERQRRTTAMLTPFMPCGAKMPIIALFAGVFFGDQAWVGTSMYFLSLFVVVLSGLIIRKITGDTTRSHFIMELPEYRVPSIKRAAISMLSRGKAFVVNAGTIILICNAIVHMLQTFTWNFSVVSDGSPNSSILASLAGPLAVLFIPLGFGLWQFAAAAITGFIAKENVVGTLAVTFGVTSFIDVEELALVAGAGEVMNIFGIGAVAGLSYLVFNLFTPPCFAAIGAMKAEIESPRWVFGAIGFQIAIGYVLSFITYQAGTFILSREIASGFFPGLIIVALIFSIIGYFMYRGGKKNE